MTRIGYTSPPLFQGEKPRLPKRSNPSKKPEQKQQFSLHTILEDTTPQRRTPVTQARTPSSKATNRTTDTRYNSAFNPEALDSRLSDPNVVNARDSRFASNPPSVAASRANSTPATPFEPGTISPFATRSNFSSAPTSFYSSPQNSGVHTPYPQNGYRK